MRKGRESENFRNLRCYSRAVVRTAVGLGKMQDDVAVGIQLDFRLINIGAAALHYPLETDFAFVVTQTPGMVLGHRHSESTLVPSRITAGDGIPSFPPYGLHSFLQNLDGRVGVVCEEALFTLRHRDHRGAAGFDGDLRSRLLNVQQSKLDRIHSYGFGHFIHHLFPAEFELLLHVASGGAGGHGIGSVVVADFLPVWNDVKVKLGTSAASASAASLTRVDMKLPLACRDVAVFLCANFELLNVFGFHLHVSQFLILCERQLDRSARHFGHVGHPRIKLLGCLSDTAKCPAVPLINESDILRIDAQATGNERSRRIDGLPMTPDRHLVAVPFRDAATWLQWSNDASVVVIRELLDDVRFSKSFFDITVLRKRCREIASSLSSRLSPLPSLTSLASLASLACCSADSSSVYIRLSLSCLTQVRGTRRHDLRQA